MATINEIERQYLKDLFAPFGIKYIIVHQSRKVSSLRVRSDAAGTIECEFGDIRAFLALSKEEQEKLIKEKLC